MTSATILYEGTKQFAEFAAMNAATEQHEQTTGHKHIWRSYWAHECRECGWNVTLSIVRGDPFNPNSAPATMRVTEWLS
jgi:hypothetical protein